MKKDIEELIMRLENTLTEYLDITVMDTEAYNQYEDILNEIEDINARIQDLPELEIR